MNAATLKANTRLAQEAWDHLRGTGVASISSVGTCVYTGSGCAFAPAILEGFHEKADKTAIACDLVDSHSILLKKWARNCNSAFAQRVQDSHDQACIDDFLPSFANGLLDSCGDYDVPVPTGLVEYLEQQS